MPTEMNEIFAFNPRTRVIEPFALKHEGNWNSRNGYNPYFLGIPVALPSVANYDKPKSVAINSKPGPNGSKVLDYSNFSIVFDKDKKLPIYTAVNIVGATNLLAMVHEQRGSDPWYQDDRIKIGDDYFQYGNSDYRGSNLQKGHMVRFYDPAWSTSGERNAIAIGDTFHYTNACPQIAKYNAGIWNDLEDYYMARAIHADKKITVFSGPIMKGARILNGLLVPLSFWKIIVLNAGVHLSAMAFLITQKLIALDLEAANIITENRMVEPTLDQEDIDRLFGKLKEWKVKISLIEEKTGLSFGLNNHDVLKGNDQYFNERLVLKESPVTESRRITSLEAFADSHMMDTDLIKSL